MTKNENMRELDSLMPLMAKFLFDAPALKWAVSLLAAVAAYILPTPLVQEAAVASMVMIVLDTLTGVVAAKYGGHDITSAKFGRFLVKCFGYSVAVLISAMASKYLSGALGENFGAGVVMLVVSGILVTEALSVIENLGKLDLKISPALRNLLEAAQKKDK